MLIVNYPGEHFSENQSYIRMSDSDDEIWHNTFPKDNSLIITPVGRDGLLIAMNKETRLPYSFRLLRILEV